MPDPIMLPTMRQTPCRREISCFRRMELVEPESAMMNGEMRSRGMYSREAGGEMRSLGVEWMSSLKFQMRRIHDVHQ